MTDNPSTSLLQATNRLMAGILRHPQALACAETLQEGDSINLFYQIGILHQSLLCAIQCGNLRRAYRYYGTLSLAANRLTDCADQMESHFNEHILQNECHSMTFG